MGTMQKLQSMALRALSKRRQERRKTVFRKGLQLAKMDADVYILIRHSGRYYYLTCSRSPNWPPAHRDVLESYPLPVEWSPPPMGATEVIQIEKDEAPRHMSTAKLATPINLTKALPRIVQNRLSSIPEAKSEEGDWLLDGEMIECVYRP